MGRQWPLYTQNKPVRLNPLGFDLTDPNSEVTANNSTSEYFDVSFTGANLVVDLDDTNIIKLEMDIPPTRPDIDGGPLSWHVWLRALNPADPTALSSAGIPDPCVVGLGARRADDSTVGRQVAMARVGGVLVTALQTGGSFITSGTEIDTVLGMIGPQAGCSCAGWLNGAYVSGQWQSSLTQWGGIDKLTVSFGDLAGSAPGGGHRMVFDAWALMAPHDQNTKFPWE